jgi:hypothetical protein
VAIINISTQYRYTGRGPFDAKAIVKTYSELLDLSTWQVTENAKTIMSAYNGMVVSVWLNKEDSSKNGLYYLYDPEVTSVLKAPDVTKPVNWHKLCNLSELTDFTAQISSINSQLTNLETRVNVVEDVNKEIASKINTLENTVSTLNTKDVELENRIQTTLNKFKEYPTTTQVDNIISAKIKEIPPVDLSNYIKVEEAENTYAKKTEVYTKLETESVIRTNLDNIITAVAPNNEIPVTSIQDLVHQVTKNALDLISITPLVEINTNKLEGIETTVVEYVENIMPTFSEDFEISEENKVSIKGINVSKLIQTDNTTLILDGGNTSK